MQTQQQPTEPTTNDPWGETAREIELIEASVGLLRCDLDDAIDNVLGNGGVNTFDREDEALNAVKAISVSIDHARDLLIELASD
jgi:hypothetical protein